MKSPFAIHICVLFIKFQFYKKVAVNCNRRLDTRISMPDQFSWKIDNKTEMDPGTE